MKNIALVLLSSLFFACNKPTCDPELKACKLKPDAGNCEAYMPRYYYDAEADQCKEFIWGGCGGTVPFETKEECEKCLCTQVPN